MVTKCNNGHWYDPNINKSCPHCKRNSEKLSLAVEAVEEDDKTVSIAEVDISLGEQLEQFSLDGMDDDKTISFGYFGITKVQPVTGWLVCLTGEERGKDFRLHTDKNFIGRSAVMDIALIDDKSISRDRHCSLTYDPRGNEFYLSPEGGNVVYHNGDTVENAIRMQSGDIIKLGETELQFIPYCKEDRQWEKN